MINQTLKNTFSVLAIALLVTFTAGLLVVIGGCGTAPNVYLDSINIYPTDFIIGQSDQGVGIDIIFRNSGRESGLLDVEVSVDGIPLEPDQLSDVPEYTGLPLTIEVPAAPNGIRAIQYFYPVTSNTQVGVHEVRVGNITRTFTVRTATGESSSGLLAGTSPTPTATQPTLTIIPSPTYTNPTPTRAPATSLPITMTPTPTPTPTPKPADLTTWTDEAYARLNNDEDYSPPGWKVSDDKSTVRETMNCQPALFYSDFLAMNSNIHVNVKAVRENEPDDDFFGFAFGFQPGDTKNHQADYLLVDWKNSMQGESLNKDFNDPACGPGGLAKEGLAVSRVNGIPTADEFWQHTDQNAQCSPIGGGLTEVKRATNLGNKGWEFDRDYDFNFKYDQTTLEVYVDGVLEISIKGNFKDGKFTLYNFSQAGVVYTVSK